MSHFLTNYFEVEQFIYRGIGVGQKVGVGGKLLRWTERGSFRRQLEYVGVSLQNWKAKHIVIHCIFSASIHIFQLFLFFFAPKSGLSSTVTKVSVCGSGGCFCFAFCPHTHLKKEGCAHDPLFVRPWYQCRLNTWAHWAVPRGPHQHSGPMLFYVCWVRHVFNV